MPQTQKFSSLAFSYLLPKSMQRDATAHSGRFHSRGQGALQCELSILWCFQDVLARALSTS